MIAGTEQICSICCHKDSRSSLRTCAAILLFCVQDGIAKQPCFPAMLTVAGRKMRICGRVIQGQSGHTHALLVRENCNCPGSYLFNDTENGNRVYFLGEGAARVSGSHRGTVCIFYRCVPGDASFDDPVFPKQGEKLLQQAAVVDADSLTELPSADAENILSSNHSSDDMLGRQQRAEAANGALGHHLHKDCGRWELSIQCNTSRAASHWSRLLKRYMRLYAVDQMMKDPDYYHRPGVNFLKYCDDMKT